MQQYSYFLFLNFCPFSHFNLLCVLNKLSSILIIIVAILYASILKIIETISGLNKLLNPTTNQSLKIGFVPTMGALHKGHISLIEKAKTENDIVVSSIFVNPTQFNDIKDLQNYPRTWDADVEKLKNAGCDILFAPSVSEIYPEGEPKLLDISFGKMENTMEGKFRTGHFKGMATVVHRLFDAVKPTIAYFGEKDFQQMSIVKKMVQLLNLDIAIKGCETIRENDGLAMSSRNIHLTDDERKEAAIISQVLFEAQKNTGKLSVHDTLKTATNRLNSSKLINLEYFEIVDSTSLQPITNWADAAEKRACVAVRIGKTRLIDNIAL
jgi:pantoate--beta-alanine ligase